MAPEEPEGKRLRVPSSARPAVATGGGLDAVVMAGGRDDPELLAAGAAQHRALIEVGGRPLLEWGLEALRSSAMVEKIILVSAAAVADKISPGLFDALSDTLSDSSGILGNMWLGAKRLDPQRPMLVIHGDLPALTPESVDDFVTRSLELNVSLTLPIITREANERKFPGTTRTYIRLREGRFTAGNGVVLGPGFLERHGAVIEQVYRGRKSPVRLARLLGLATMIKWLTGRLSLAQIEARASRILGAPATAVISEYAELGFDIDKPSDLEAARRWHDRQATP
jgi:GTP:adenosylcobinamide-phosphate guanylyltransferase